MPIVNIQHSYDLTYGSLPNQIEEKLRPILAENLSVKDVVLSPKDFSISFIRVTGNPVSPITLIILAEDLADRNTRRDEISENIKSALLSKMNWSENKLRVGLFLMPMGWSDT